MKISADIIRSKQAVIIIAVNCDTLSSTLRFSMTIASSVYQVKYGMHQY